MHPKELRRHVLNTHTFAMCLTRQINYLFCGHVLDIRDGCKFMGPWIHPLYYCRLPERNELPLEIMAEYCPNCVPCKLIETPFYPGGPTKLVDLVGRVQPLAKALPWYCDDDNDDDTVDEKEVPESMLAAFGGLELHDLGVQRLNHLPDGEEENAGGWAESVNREIEPREHAQGPREEDDRRGRHQPKSGRMMPEVHPLFPGYQRTERSRLGNQSLQFNHPESRSTPRNFSKTAKGGPPLPSIESVMFQDGN